MKLNELNSETETEEKKLETYTEFKKRNYIYRVDDIVSYLQRDNTKLDKLFKKETKLFNDLINTLTPEQKSILSKYSDNWLELLSEEVNELTQYILKDFEEER